MAAIALLYKRFIMLMYEEQEATQTDKVNVEQQHCEKIIKSRPDDV